MAASSTLDLIRLDIAAIHVSNLMIWIDATGCSNRRPLFTVFIKTRCLVSLLALLVFLESGVINGVISCGALRYLTGIGGGS